LGPKPVTTTSSTAAFSDVPTSPSSATIVGLANASARVIVSEPAHGWRDTVKARLNELVRLREGWDGYHAVPVSFVSANFALRVLEAVSGADAPYPQIVPGPDGDLQMEWHTNSADIELHVIGPNQVHAWRLVNGSPSPEELMLGNDFTTVARWINQLSGPPIAIGTAAA
jgi:hypothetical protein